MRGRLIWPQVASIFRYDPEATAADPDGTGPLTSGFDSFFREPEEIHDTTPAGSHSARKEKAEIRVRCQFEDNEEERLKQIAGGAAPQFNVVCVFHYRDLEVAGLVDGTTGIPLIRVGDRLDALYEVDGTLIRKYANPPGMFATRIQSSGFGLSSRKRNLLLVTFEDRQQGAG